jgi:outer membrane protein OmpA-like peptidoglycan-associated protein
MEKIRIHRALAWGVAALVWGVGAEALADDPIASSNGKGMDTHLFRPAMDSKGLFSINGTEVLGANDISFGLILDYGETLLRVTPTAGAPGPILPNAAQTVANQLINNSFQGTFQFNYGLKNLLVVGLDLPIILMTGNAEANAAGNPVVDGWGTGQLNSQNLEFIGIHGKLRLLRVERGLGVAVGLQAGVPVTDAPRQAGADPGAFVWPQLMLEKRIGSRGQFKVDLNAGYRVHAATSTTLPLANGKYADGNLFTYGGGAAYRIFPSVDVVAETYGTYLVSSDASNDVKAPNEVVGGLKLFVERNSYFMLGAGPRYTPGFEAADVRAFLGFVYEPSIGDRDGDGIKDDVDKCPDEPEDFDGFQDADGCPDPDNDNDGVLDVDDRCPNVPGPKENDGCPEVKDGDRDGDGIPDSQDKCPDEPEDRDGFQDKDGCPDPDNDHDGIPDKLDACPNDPEDFDGFQDKDGCPDPDNDKDGIPDVVDKCPNEPETFNGYQDEDGCPDKGSVIIQENNIIILDKIKFKTDSAEILPESDKILDAVATTINHHPEFVLMEVAGHADERGDDFYNLRLTQNRVNSVMAALIERGVDKSRLRSKGYGEYCPEDPGHNDAAWEKNRRVEFKIVKTKDGPTGVELGCANASSHGVRPGPVP